MSNELTTNADVAAVFKAIMDAAKGQAAPRKDPPGVEWEGTKIKLPAEPGRMTHREAANWLVKMEDEQNRTVAVVEDVENGTPWDGALALNKACREMFGFTEAKPTPGMFGSQNPPVYIAVETAFGETDQIFWGRVTIPGVPGFMQTVIHEKRGRYFLRIYAETQQRFAEVFKRIAARTRELLAAGSIYRGKAFKLHVTDNGQLNWNEAPSFLDLRKIDRDQLIFSTALMEDVQDNVLTHLEHTQLCRDNKVPLKRGVLLAGPYGTGKTLLATVLAKIATDNGWTYVTIERVTALKQALEFAKLYQPCLVFCEDIDREMSGERDAEMDDILNTIDGVSSKGTEVMVVLTSNHAEKITKAMVRPGRLDVVLNIEPPDAEAAERLIRLYAGRLVHKTTDLSEAGKALDGLIPAVIRECVERAKLHAISKRPGLPFELVDGDFVAAARTMRRHLELMAEPRPDAKSHGDRMLSAMVEGINHHLGNGADEGLSAKVAEISRQVERIEEWVNEQYT